MAINVKYFILSALLFISLYACSPEKALDVKLQSKLGKETIEIVRSPSNVEIDRKIVKVNSKEFKEFQTLLLDDKSYNLEATKTCVFIPTKIVVLSKEGKSVKLIFSELCNQLQVVANDKTSTLDYDPVKIDMNTIINKIDN